jgi:hypothetical protein
MNKFVGKLFMISCAAACLGCAARVDDGTSSEARELDQATPALSNCSAFNRVETVAPPGSVGVFGFLRGSVTDQLQCNGVPGQTPQAGDGVLCSRTCFYFFAASNGSPIVSRSLKCENRPTPSVLGPSLDLSILRPECRIQPISRVNAGFSGISRSVCEGRGSCFDNRTTDPNFAWCYEPIGKAQTCAGQLPSERVNAGFPGIQSQECVVTRGKCWNDRTPSVPFCFEPTELSRTGVPTQALPPF